MAADNRQAMARSQDPGPRQSSLCRGPAQSMADIISDTGHTNRGEASPRRDRHIGHSEYSAPFMRFDSAIAISSTGVAAQMGMHLDEARQQNDEWANILISRMVGVLQEYPLEVWTLKVSTKSSPAISSLLAEGEEITISNLCTDPRNREECLACIPLLLRRGNTEELLPTETQILHVGDSFLFCGTREAERHMKWTAWDHNALTYICKGIDRPSGYVWSRLSRQRG